MQSLVDMYMKTEIKTKSDANFFQRNDIWCYLQRKDLGSTCYNELLIGASIYNVICKEKNCCSTC